MSGSNVMSNTDLWDETEFNFFKTLDDDDKLMYIYDLCLGEFESDFIFEEDDNDINDAMESALRSMGESLEDSEDEEFDDNEIQRNPVTVQIAIDTLTITGPTLDVILKVASDMQMNGLMISDRNIEFTKYEPWDVVLSYKIIGNGAPISLN